MTAATSGKPGMSLQCFFQAVCDQCGSVIPQSHITARMIPARHYEMPRRIFTAWCEHCDVIYSSTRELSDGQWLPISETKLITDPEARKVILDKIGKLHGDRQQGGDEAA